MNTTFLARRIRQLAPGFTDAEVVQLVETLAQKHLDPDEYFALVRELDSSGDLRSFGGTVVTVVAND